MNLISYMKKNDKGFYFKMLGIILLILLLIGLGIKLNTTRISQIDQEVKLKKEIEKINLASQEYEKNRSALDSGVLRKPLARNKLDLYQAGLMKLIESKNIHVQNVTALPPRQNNQAYEYEVTWLGAWGSIMDVLNHINRDSVAINITDIKMESNSENSDIKCQVKYKVYIVEEG